MGGGTKYSQSTATQQLPGYLNDAYQKLVGQATNTASTGYTPYTGGFTSDQQQAFGNIRGLTGSSDAAFGSSSAALNAAMNPTYNTVQNYMNPYLDQVAGSMMDVMQEQNQRAQQGVVGNAIAKGAMGGNRVGVAQGELARQQKLADNQALSQLYQQGYQGALGAAQADKSASLDAAGKYAGLGQTQMQTNLGQAAAQLGAGTQQQQFDYQQYLNELSFPYQQQSWLAGILGNLGPSAGGTTTESKPQGNIFSQLLGAGLGMASLFRHGGSVPHAAQGGTMPYANDNGLWPGANFSGMPFANDNGDFGSYVPKVAMNGGRGAFPTISSDGGGEDDYFSKYSSVMKEGAGNIKDWMSPREQARMPGLYADGGIVGRNGYAGGGVPMVASPYLFDETFNLVALPDEEKRKINAEALRRDPPQRPTIAESTIDAVAPINGDNLGLGSGNGEVALAYSSPEETLSPYNVERFGPGDEPARVRVADAGGMGVPFSTGDQFVTAPTPGYSENIGDAWNSLSAGKGLNLSPDMRQSLLAAGMGMMSSHNPFFFGGVGEGGLKGIETWNARQALERENAAQRASNALTGSQMALQAEQAGLTSAEAGRTTQATDIDRWESTRTPYGMVIRDKTRGDDPGQLYKWGEVMPNGETANPAAAGAMEELPPLFSTSAPTGGPEDYRLMVPEYVGGIAAQTDQTIAQAREESRASQASQQLLTEMRHQLDALPENGLMVPGAGFEARAAFGKTYVTAMNLLGMHVDPKFAEEVGAAEDLNKLTTRLGFDLSKTLGSNEAATIVMQSLGAVPGGLNTPEGAERVMAGLEAANRRRIDYHKFLEDWVRKHSNSTLGADVAFNQQNPPELYALSAFVPREAMEFLRSHPDQAAAFNAKYGNGQDVSRFILGQ